MTRTDRPLALLVEDQRVIADDMRHLLEEMGLRTRTCPTGEAALAWLALNEGPDVVILDIELPSVSGYDVLRKLRGELATRDVPVVVLPAQPAPGRGAKEYPLKAVSGVDRLRLIQTIQETLARDPKRRLVVEAIQESLSGLLSKRRAEARLEGVVDRSVPLRISIDLLLDLVKARLDGLRGEDAPDESPDSLDNDDASDEDDIVDALEVEAPSLADLRDLWLPALGVSVRGDDVELDVEVPAPRRAHAR